MQQIDLTTSPVPIITPSSNSTILASTTITDRMISFKSTFMGTTHKKPLPPLSFRPLSINFEMATFLNLVHGNQSIGLESFWKSNSRTLP